MVIKGSVKAVFIELEVELLGLDVIEHLEGH
jgi:hypothetical protein